MVMRLHQKQIRIKHKPQDQKPKPTSVAIAKSIYNKAISLEIHTQI